MAGRGILFGLNLFYNEYGDVEVMAILAQIC